MTRPLTLAALCACALACRAGDDGEVRLKPKAYAPGQTLRDAAYRETLYAPSSRSSAPAEKRVAPPRAASRWHLFSRPKPLDAPAKLAAAPAPGEPAYTQEKRISVSTLQADPRDAPEKKPFDESGKKLADAAYKAPEKPREKNPLLAPRQGIKAAE